MLPPDPPPRPLGVGGLIVVVLFLVSGTVHLMRPGVYESIVPDLLPAHALLVVVSGLAELACALGLIAPATRRGAGWASVVLLVAIFPANVQMAYDAWRGWRVHDGSGLYLLGTLVRLPLQLPLIWWVFRVTRTRDGGPDFRTRCGGGTAR
jgi:uncharacterized membrane protein